MAAEGCSVSGASPSENSAPSSVCQAKSILVCLAEWKRGVFQWRQGASAAAQKAFSRVLGGGTIHRILRVVLCLTGLFWWNLLLKIGSLISWHNHFLMACTVTQTTAHLPQSAQLKFCGITWMHVGYSSCLLCVSVNLFFLFWYSILYYWKMVGQYFHMHVLTCR